MTFSQKTNKIRQAIRNGYYVTGTRNGWTGWSALYEENGELKYARGEAPELRPTDQIRVAVQVDIAKWDLGTQREVNKRQVA